jgi:membrane protein implicated in regulation of membrane protease activity
MTPDSSPFGRIGVLTVSTRGATGPGEVLIKIRGGSETFLAWSDEPLPKGTTVLVVHSRGTRTVDVTRWIEPSSFTPDFPD